MYERKRYLCGDSIEVEECHTGRYGAPGMKRGPKKKPTPEQIEKQNQWRKERDIRRLLKVNFEEHDYWITLTYKKGSRPEMEQAKKQVQKFLRQMRDQYKKRGSPLKYIVKTEIGSKGGIHHHIVMNRIEGGDKLAARFWTHGYAAYKLLYTEGGFRSLADYIAKKEGQKDTWYSRSRNLKQPKVERRIMRRKTFSQEIKVPKGYYLEKESVYEGANPVTGHPYRHYTLVRMNGRC